MPSTPAATTTDDDDDARCACQRNLWICRPCYRARWMADITYASGGWLASASPASIVCAGCSAPHTHATDTRLPARKQTRDDDFRVWMQGQQPAPRPSRKPQVGAAKTSSSSSALLLPPPPPPPPPPPSPPPSTSVSTSTSTTAATKSPPGMRPVACSWCMKHVDAAAEVWGLRPDSIKRGEEKGRLWQQELERRRREREDQAAGGTNSGSSTANASTNTEPGGVPPGWEFLAGNGGGGHDDGSSSSSSSGSGSGSSSF